MVGVFLCPQVENLLELGSIANFNCIDRITWGSADKDVNWMTRKFGKSKCFYYIYTINKTCMNKTSKDYRKELTNHRNKIKSLESRIKDRLIKMIELFPDAVIYETFTCRNVTKEWLDNLDTDRMLNAMRTIEDYNAQFHPQQLDLFA